MSRLITMMEDRKTRTILVFLAIFAFLESFILPIPVDIFTLGLSALRPKRWFLFFLVATISSVLGAVFAYFFASHFSPWAEEILKVFHYEALFEKTRLLFEKKSFLLMFTSAFTPLPYKVFTLSAGLVRAPLAPFITASLLGRGLRFFIESYLGMRFGADLAKKYIKHMNQLLIFIGAGVAVYLIFNALFLR